MRFSPLLCLLLLPLLAAHGCGRRAESPPPGRAGEPGFTGPARPAVVASVDLEDIHPGSVVSGEEPDAALAFSRDGSLVALGTFGGYLRVFETGAQTFLSAKVAGRNACPTIRLLFEKRFPGAVVKRVALSDDNSRVYAGEMSYDGFVYAFDLASKRELWRFRLADELETSRPARPDDFFALYSYPQAYCMKAAGADLLVSGLHSWRKEGARDATHLSRLYRFDGATGRVLWKYPPAAPIPRNISWFDADNDSVAFGAYQWEPVEASDPVPQSAVVLLDAKSGERLASRRFEPLAPLFTTVPMWYGLAFDREGRLAVGLMDGRAFLYTGRKLEEIASLDLAPPVSVTGVPIYAGVGWAAGSDGTLYLLTDGRLIAPSASATGKTVRADHPSSNTLFAFDARTGKLLWRWKLTTTAQSVAAGGSLVAVSTQQSYSADDPMDYGVTVFDSGRPGGPLDKLQYRFHTAGPIVALAASPDGRTVAAVEAPVRLPDGLTVVGRYRLHIFH